MQIKWPVFSEAQLTERVKNKLCPLSTGHYNFTINVATADGV